MKKHYRCHTISRFRGKETNSNKVSDHCHLTAKYRGPADNKCNINVAEKQSDFNSFVFHNFSKYDCHLIFKNLVDKKNEKEN